MAANPSFKEYVINIRANVKEAQDAIDQLGEQLDKKTGGIDIKIDKSIGDNFNLIKGSINRVTEAITEMKNSFSDVESAKEIKNLTKEFTESIDKMTQSFEKFSSTFNTEGGMGETFSNFTKQLKNIIEQYQDAMKLIQDVHDGAYKLTGETPDETQNKPKRNKKNTTSDNVKKESISLKDANKNFKDAIEEYKQLKEMIFKVINEPGTLESQDIEKARIALGKLNKLIEEYNKIEGFDAQKLLADNKADISVKGIGQFLANLNAQFEDKVRKERKDREPIVLPMDVVVDPKITSRDGITGLVTQIRKAIYEKVETRLAKDPIKIPIAFTSAIKESEIEHSTEKDILEKFSGTKEEHEKKIIKQLKLDIDLDRKALIEKINSEITGVNEWLKGDDAPKIHIKVVPDVDKTAIQNAVYDITNKVQEENEVNGRPEGLTVPQMPSTVSISNLGGIATENTSREILNELRRLISNGVSVSGYTGNIPPGSTPSPPPSGPGTPPPPPITPPSGGGGGGSSTTYSGSIDAPDLDKNEEIIMREFMKKVLRAKYSFKPTAARAQQDDTTEYLLSTYADETVRHKELGNLIKALQKEDSVIEQLRASDLYNKTIQGTNIAYYGNGETTELWQRKLETTFNAYIQEIAKQLDAPTVRDETGSIISEGIRTRFQRIFDDNSVSEWQNILLEDYRKRESKGQKIYATPEEITSAPELTGELKSYYKLVQESIIKQAINSIIKNPEVATSTWSGSQAFTASLSDEAKRSAARKRSLSGSLALNNVQVGEGRTVKQLNEDIKRNQGNKGDEQQQKISEGIIVRAIKEALLNKDLGLAIHGKDDNELNNIKVVKRDSKEYNPEVTQKYIDKYKITPNDPGLFKILDRARTAINRKEGVVELTQVFDDLRAEQAPKLREAEMFAAAAQQNYDNLEEFVSLYNRLGELQEDERARLDGLVSKLQQDAGRYFATGTEKEMFKRLDELEAKGSKMSDAESKEYQTLLEEYGKKRDVSLEQIFTYATNTLPLAQNELKAANKRARAIKYQTNKVAEQLIQENAQYKDITRSGDKGYKSRDEEIAKIREEMNYLEARMAVRKDNGTFDRSSLATKEKDRYEKLKDDLKRLEEKQILYREYKGEKGERNTGTSIYDTLHLSEDLMEAYSKIPRSFDVEAIRAMTVEEIEKAIQVLEKGAQQNRDYVSKNFGEDFDSSKFAEELVQKDIDNYRQQLHENNQQLAELEQQLSEITDESEKSKIESQIRPAKKRQAELEEIIVQLTGYTDEELQIVEKFKQLRANYRKVDQEYKDAKESGADETKLNEIATRRDAAGQAMVDYRGQYAYKSNSWFEGISDRENEIANQVAQLLVDAKLADEEYKRAIDSGYNTQIQDIRERLLSVASSGEFDRSLTQLYENQGSKENGLVGLEDLEDIINDYHVIQQQIQEAQNAGDEGALRQAQSELEDIMQELNGLISDNIAKFNIADIATTPIGRLLNLVGMLNTTSDKYTDYMNNRSDAEIQKLKEARDSKYDEASKLRRTSTSTRSSSQLQIEKYVEEYTRNKIDEIFRQMIGGLSDEDKQKYDIKNENDIKRMLKPRNIEERNDYIRRLGLTDEEYQGLYDQYYAMQEMHEQALNTIHKLELEEQQMRISDTTIAEQRRKVFQQR